MPKRNLILLIIIVIAAVIGISSFLYFRQGTTTPGEPSTGTNFFSQFNPFGTSSPSTPPVVTPPVDVSGFEPGPGEETKLVKVSSMPVAGFGVYVKERLKDVAIVSPVATPVIRYDFGTTTIKNGSTGEGVMEIQKFLNNTLNLNLELNGIVGVETTAGIKQWQSENGLVADGVVGAKTKAVMYTSVNQKTATTKLAPPPTEFVPAIRYVARATGNIYQTFADKIDERKFSGTTIPKVYDAYFGNHGESVIMRYLKIDAKTIETFVGTLPKEFLGGDTTENNEIKGFFLPENVKDISLSPDTLKVFYLFSTSQSIIGTTLNFSNNKKFQVFDSPFTEWLSQWPNNNMITMSTKPSRGVLGHVYSIDPDRGSFSRILGDVGGLTTLTSPNGKLVLYSDDILSLRIYHTDTRIADLLGIKTLPEKCVWGLGSETVYCAVPRSIPVGQYPDTWYQGEVTFSDQLWKIDVNSGTTTLILDPVTVTGGEEVDGIKLAMDSGENYLFFVNKKDSYLWKLNIK